MARVRKNSINSFSVKSKGAVAPVLKPGEYIMKVHDVNYDPHTKKVDIKYLLADGTIYNGTYNLVKRNGEQNDFIIELLADIETQALDSADSINEVNPSILNSCIGRFIAVDIINREYNGRLYDLFAVGGIYPATGFDDTGENSEAADNFYSADEDESA